MIVCTWPDDRVVELHGRGELNFYVARVILNQIRSNTSPFYNTYRKLVHSYEEIEWEEDGNNNNKAVLKHIKNISNEVSRKLNGQTGKIYERPTPVIDIEERAKRELLEDFTLEQINHLPFYESEMVKLYMKAGSYRSMEKMTRIPHESCHKTVRKAIQKLRGMADVKKAKAIFTKEELKFIQNNK